MGIVKEIGLGDIQEKEVLRQCIKAFRGKLYFRINNSNREKEIEGEDQKEFINELEKCIDILNDRDGMVQPVIQTFGFAYDTQSRRKEFKVDYSDIKTAIEGDGKKSFGIAKTLRENGEEVLASTWERWAEKNGYEKNRNTKVTNQGNNTNKRIIIETKLVKRKKEHSKKTKGNRRIGIIKIPSYMWIIAFILALILFFAGLSSVISHIEDSRHPSYLVGRWIRQGSTGPNITLYSGGKSHYDVYITDGKWYVENGNLIVSHWWLKYPFSIKSENEIISSDGSHYYKLKGNKEDDAEKTDKHYLEKVKQEGEGKFGISDDAIKYVINGEKTEDNIIPLSDILSANVGDIQDNFGNEYPFGICGESSTKETRYDIANKMKYKKMTGRIVLESEHRTRETIESFVSIFGDDEVLYESGSVSAGFEPQDFNIDVSDVETIRVVISGEHQACLVDAYLYESEDSTTVTRRIDYEYGDKTNICYAFWYDSSSAFDDESGFITYLEPEDNEGNSYINGIGGRADLYDNWCKYRVNDQITRLTGRIILAADCADGAEGSSCVKIYCDEEIVFQSTPIGKEYHGEDFDIDLSGVKDLMISIDGGDAIRIVNCYLKK